MGVQTTLCAAAFQSGQFWHHAVILALDSTAPALWEDTARAREFLELATLLRCRGYILIVAVTKLATARSQALSAYRRGCAHNGMPHRSSYEAFVDMYIEKVCRTVNDLSTNRHLQPSSDDFLVPGSTIFDAPTWVSRRDWRIGHTYSRGLPRSSLDRNLPHWTYVHSQLHRILSAAQELEGASVPPRYQTLRVMTR